jgi:hypothetical protein
MNPTTTANNPRRVIAPDKPLDLTSPGFARRRYR